MKLDELECFLEVAKQKNMTVAGNALHLGQATVSERIQRLETQIGLPLFERRDRRVELTPAGKRLLAAAGQFVDVAEDIRAQSRFGRARAQPIRIGVNGPVAHAWLGGWLVRLRAEQPGLAFDLKVDDRRAGRDDGGRLPRSRDRNAWLWLPRDSLRRST